MKYIVYILLCDQKTFYVGITRDIEKRLEEHKSKTSFFTKKFSDIQLVYQELYKTIQDAEKRERQLKGWSFAKKKALVEGQIELLKRLSKAVSLAKPSEG
jgi:putative endonuclease